MCVFIEDWKMVGEIGFEPTTYWSQTSRATRLRYTPRWFFEGNNPHSYGFTVARLIMKGINHHLFTCMGTWWVLTGSNRRPTPCKGAALPTELRTRY